METVVGLPLTPAERIVFRKEVKKKQIDLGLTTRLVAGRIGYSDATLYKAMSSGTIPLVIVNALVNELEIDIDDVKQKALEKYGANKN